MIEAIYSFEAAADIRGVRGSFPTMVLICKACGRPLFGDWQYNFTDSEAHAGCVRNDVLYVQVRIDGLLGKPL